MAKRTHHTNNNQNRKDHRNGIKRPKKHKLVDTPGINDKRLRNIIISRLKNQKVVK
ncbi:large subunit ribosomal protein L29e [Pancytospora epiphaga]|nr:large subunit ribosomal protein L29e [Pancytospora epiphaga]